MELTDVVNRLVADGHPVTNADIAALSPYATKHILRFGDYVLDLTPPTAAASTHLELDVTERA